MTVLCLYFIKIGVLEIFSKDWCFRDLLKRLVL